MLGCAKKAFAKIVLVFLATLSCPVLAEDLLWTNGSGNGLWGISNNWSPARLPSLDGDTARINSLPGPLIDDVDGECQWLILSDGASASLNMTSGTLFIFDFVTFADDSGFIIANTPAGAGTFTLDGGLVRTGPGSNVYVGYKGQGTIFMNGGTFEIQGLLGIGYCDTGISTGRGCVYLDGGTITAADFQMASPAGCTGLLDISGGTLIVDGDKTSLINGYIADGRIVAYDGTGVVAVDYNITNLGQTTVRSLIDPRQAANPNPAHNEASVPLDVNFSWTGGVGATSHRVYFGAASPGTFQGEQDANSYNPPVLDGNTTYYWRVDEVVGANTVTGVVWKFTTDDGLAKNPDPANATGGVAADEVLHWTAGSGATSHDVYFGTDAAAVAAAQRLAGDLDASGQVDFNDVLILISRWQADPAGSVPYAGVNDDNLVDFNDYALLAQNWMAKSSSVFRGNVTVASYEPDLVQDCNYYWRIDEVCGAKRRKGNVWSFTTYYSLVGKVMCGYQGWFNTSTDGASRNWRHWPDNGTTAPTPTNIHVDMWPDMTEMDADEKYEATAFAGGSNHYYLFSSRNLKTVRRHFKWMQDYGVDGVYLQRFATEVINQGDSSFTNRNYVLDYCKDGANMYGRKYAIMYDLTGLDLGKMQKVMDDWKYLVNTKQVTRDPADYAYMRHRGKPVVAVWGIGFTDRKYTWAECLALVNFLHDDPVYGNNIVIIGVNDSWRSYITDPTMAAIATKADIISPWSVGRYKYPGELTNFTNNVWVPDMLWCQTNSTPSHPIEYLPVIWPGFSWQNMHADVQPPDSPDNYPLNQYPRNGGQFLWDQVNKTVGTAHANMLYIAMFDEVDEGTAIFKVTNNPPRPGGVDMFVTYEGLPSDEYLWLTGQAGKALRGEIPVSIARPNR
jgi:hypothetical protein